MTLSENEESLEMSKTNTNRVNTEGAEREARTRFERLVTAAGVSVKETGKTAAGEYFDPRVALAWKLYRALHHAGRPAGWLPISSAPRGKEVVLFARDLNGNAEKFVGRWYPEALWLYYPTHWMPLPQSPE